MTRSEIVERFREQNTEFPSNVISDTICNSWLLLADKEFCAITRCIRDQDGETITTAEDDQYWDLTAEIDNFYDIDDYPGSGVTYNDKRLKNKTMAQLDAESSTWRSRSAGTPEAWYRRGKWLYLDRPIDSNAHDLKVYSVLLSDDWDSDVAPYNQLTYLEPYHDAMIRYLVAKAKAKKGKRQDALRARQDFLDYANWVKSQLGGTKFAPIYFQPKAEMY